jgi:hypothetical protein
VVEVLHVVPVFLALFSDYTDELTIDDLSEEEKDYKSQIPSKTVVHKKLFLLSIVLFIPLPFYGS